MKKWINIFLIISPTILMSCDSETLYLSDVKQIVVRAYLYAGMPVNDIQLTTTFSTVSEDSTGIPIKNASVILEKDGRKFHLVSSPGDSGYYHYPGRDLDVKHGDQFKLIVDYNGEISFAETSIPSPPKDVTISSDRYLISEETVFDTTSIIVSWSDEVEALYFVTIENLEKNPTSIDSIFENNIRRFQSFRSRPVSGNTFRIRNTDLSHLGKHRVRVFKINREYANLYTFGNQDSRNLNEPETNIHNGLGVFAGFNSDFVEFTVIEN